MRLAIPLQEELSRNMAFMQTSDLVFAAAASGVPSASAQMIALEAVALKLADSDCPVLITGEPGTGKRTLARQIHLASGHRDEPFYTMECEFLTVTKNNGSGAEREWPNRGVLYLREIDKLSLEAQRDILNRMGQSPSLCALRILAGNGDGLVPAVRAKRMDDEFFHAISSVCLRIPPLRARRQDIVLLAKHFLVQYSLLFGRPVPEPSPGAMEFFLSYRWPGNITELETAMKSLVAIGDERVVLAALRSAVLTGGSRDEWQPASLKQAARAASQEAERELISTMLASTGWNRKRAAERLQVSYKAFLYKLKRSGIESPSVHRADGE